MNVEEIVKLIEACKTSGVQKLKFEKLELMFHPPEQIAAAAIAERRSSQVVETENPMDEDLEDILVQNLLIAEPLEYENARRKMSYAQDSR